MLNFDLYAIYTTDNEYNGSIKEYFVSFEDAMNNRMKYADWWSPNGRVTIKKFPANSSMTYASESWDIHEDGRIIKYHKW